MNNSRKIPKFFLCFALTLCMVFTCAEAFADAPASVTRVPGQTGSATRREQSAPVHAPKFRVYEGTAESGLEWISDLNRKLNVFSLTSLAKSSGKPLVAPGIQGSYRFTVASADTQTLRYVLNIDEQNPHEIPIEVRLRHADGTFIEGNDSMWLSVPELKSFETLLEPFSAEGFILDWRWQYDEERDPQDTALGMLASSTTVSYKMDFSVTAEPLPGTETVLTGDFLSYWASWALLVCSLVLLLTVGRKPRKEGDLHS